MSDIYTVYRYIPNNIHEDNFDELLAKLKLTIGNKVLFNNHEMLYKWLYHFFVTFGKVKVFSLINEDGVAHYSFFTPYCHKFSFMGKYDYIIGPCWTKDELRGNRIYPITINKIALELSKKRKGTHIYLLVRPDNKESTNAVIHTTGWISVGTIKKTRFKNYKNCEWI